MHFSALHSARLCFFVLLPISLATAQAHLPNRGQKVYVVGVRDTRGLSCGVCYKMYPDSRPLLDRSVPDEALQSAARKEFRKEGRYVIADSAEHADFVFIIQGDYGPVLVERSKSSTPGGVFASFGVALDQKPDHLLGVAAIAVPAFVYRQAPDNWPALFMARLWGGCLNTISFIQGVSKIAANPETLVRTFPNKVQKTPSSSLRVCSGLSGKQAAGEVESQAKSEGAATRTTRKPAPKGLADGANVQVTVDFVSVPVIASDPDGKYIPDLKQSDFHIYEDDVEQEIDRLVTAGDPLNVALLIDSSWSMAQKFDQVQQPALALVESLRPEDRLMVLSFDDKIHIDTEFTSDRLELRRAILATRQSDTTRLYDALDLVLAERLNAITGRKAIVLFTDGMDTSSWLTNSAGALDKLEESNAIIYAVQREKRNDLTPQFQPGWVPEAVPPGMDKTDEAYAKGSQFLQDLASRSGGRFFQAATISNSVVAFDQIADELRHQYVLGYYPSNRTRDGSYRRIRVTVDRPGVRIRARSGYRAAAAPSSK